MYIIKFKYYIVAERHSKKEMEFGVRHSWISFIVPPLTSLGAQMVKYLPTMQETQVQSLGWEDHLEKEMATHSSILVWKIPRTEEPGRLQSMVSQRVGHE